MKTSMHSTMELEEKVLKITWEALKTGATKSEPRDTRKHSLKNIKMVNKYTQNYSNETST